MLTTLDGKIIGDYLEEERTQYFIDEYEKIHEVTDAKHINL